MVKKSIKIEEVIEFFNELLKIDPIAINSIFGIRVPCNKELANHESVQVGSREGKDWFTVSTIGILNGLFGIDEYNWGHLSIEYENYQIKKFKLLTIEDIENYAGPQKI